MLKKISLLILLVILSSCSGSDKARRSIVKIMSADGMCSGEQIEAPSGEKYILTAGHCRHLNINGIYSVYTEDGRVINRKFIAEDDKSDLLLIEGVPNLPALKIASYEYPTQAIRTLTHGDNMSTYQTTGVLIESNMIQAALFPIENEQDEKNCQQAKNSIVDSLWLGRVCLLNEYEMISTALVVPGSSGGAVLNKHDELTGVVSVGKGPFSGFVLLVDIKNFLKNY